MENIVVVANHKKKIEIITRIHVCLISQINFICKENSGKKSFSCKYKALVSCIPMWRTWLWCLIIIKIEVITRIQVYLIARMNFDYKKNGEKKVFLANMKHQYCISQHGEHDCGALLQKEWRLLRESKFDSFHR